jgi:hypothetical protein
VYLYDLRTDAVRLLAAGDFAGPHQLRFSHSDSILAAAWHSRLIAIEVGTGQSHTLTYTDNGIADPEWGKDDGFILYSRIFLDQFPPEPPDSAGVHVYTVATGTDTALKVNGEVLYGSRFRWLAAADAFAFAAVGKDGSGGIYYTRWGGQPRRLAVGRGASLENLQWLTGSDAMTHLLYCELFSDSTVTWTVDTLGLPSLSNAPQLRIWDVLTSDGRQVAFAAPQPSDSLGVFYLGDVEGACIVPRRQLTRWEEAGR